jgi:hypothetical protein
MRCCVIKTSCCPCPFVSAFRIVAWQALYHGERVRKLGPRYHCATCVLPEKDLRRGCPGCELTTTFEYFKRRCIFEAYKRYGTTKRLIEVDEAVWPFEMPLMDVLEAYSSVRRLLDDNDEKISRKWDFVVATLARVILQERSQFQFGQSYEG